MDSHSEHPACQPIMALLLRLVAPVCSRCRSRRNLRIPGRLVPGNASVICCAIQSAVGCAVTSPDQLSPSQTNNDQDVELDKRHGRDHEQIHGGNVRWMVAQKGAPALTRTTVTRLGHVFGDRSAQPEQLAVDVRRSPKLVLSYACGRSSSCVATICAKARSSSDNVTTIA